MVDLGETFSCADISIGQRETSKRTVKSERDRESSSNINLLLVGSQRVTLSQPGPATIASVDSKYEETKIEKATYKPVMSKKKYYRGIKVRSIRILMMVE